MFVTRYSVFAFFLLCFTGHAQSYDLRIMELDHHAFETPGNYDVQLMFQNMGSTNAQNIKLKWSLNGNIDSTNVTFSSPLLPSGGGTNYYASYTLVQGLEFPLEGEYDFLMWIDAVEGVPDGNPANDSIGYLIQVVDYLPAKRVLLEKYSHHTCGPCYQGDLDTETLLDAHSNLSAVTIHEGASDPMEFQDGAILDATFSTAHPNFVFDRMLYTPSEEYGSMIWGGVSGDLEKRIQMREGLQVNFVNNNYNPTTRELTVEISAEFFADYYEALAFNLYVTEDSVFGYQANAPNPNDYYHMHVARAILGGPFGTDITGTTLDGSLLTHTFTYVLPAGFNAEQIKVTAFVQRKDAGLLDVVNSTDQRSILDSWLDLAGLDATQIHVYPNPAHEALIIQCDQAVRGATLFDMAGTRLGYFTGNVLPLSGVAAGTYLVQIELEAGTYLKRIVKD
jgi:hypothetical protein